MLTAVTGCGDSVPLGESSDADWWPGVYCTLLYCTALYTVHGHLSRLTWCRQVAASGVAPASARGPASAALAAHTLGTLTTAQIWTPVASLILQSDLSSLPVLLLYCWTAELVLICKVQYCSLCNCLAFE